MVLLLRLMLCSPCPGPPPTRHPAVRGLREPAQADLPRIGPHLPPRPHCAARAGAEGGTARGQAQGRYEGAAGRQPRGGTRGH